MMLGVREGESARAPRQVSDMKTAASEMGRFMDLSAMGLSCGPVEVTGLIDLVRWPGAILTVFDLI